MQKYNFFNSGSEFRSLSDAHDCLQAFARFDRFEYVFIHVAFRNADCYIRDLCGHYTFVEKNSGYKVDCSIEKELLGFFGTRFISSSYIARFF